MSDASTFLFRGRYIPWLFVGGFAIVIAVNAVMIWFAVGSFSGLYSDRAREVGLHYNRRAQLRARQIGERPVHEHDVPAVHGFFRYCS